MNLRLSHVSPVYPDSQVQLNPMAVSVHVPPFLQVSEEQGITSGKNVFLKRHNILTVGHIVA